MYAAAPLVSSLPMTSRQAEIPTLPRTAGRVPSLADELGAHVDASMHALTADVLDLQAEQCVEGDPLLEELAHAGDEFGLSNCTGCTGGRGFEGRPCSLASKRQTRREPGGHRRH